MADRTLVYVKVSSRANWLYGFATSLDQADRTALGHTAYVANAAGVVFGVNSPKPARMKKTKDSGETVSSFVDESKRASAATAGWKLVKRARARISRPTARNVPVFVKVPVGSIIIQYAWNMPKRLHDAISSDLAGLGINAVATENDAFDLCWGARLEVPRAHKTVGGYSTFYSPQIASLPAGWTGVGGEVE